MDWKKREKKYCYWNRLLLSIYCILGCITLFNGVMEQDERAIVYSAAAFLLYLIPDMAQRTFKITLAADFRLLYSFFIFGAVAFGSGMDGYTLIPWWDLFLHYLSGILMGLIGLLIFNKFCKNGGVLNKTDLPIVVLFVNLFATASAAFWEYYEFALDYFLGTDTQITVATGVVDTMTDMLVCTLGGAMVSWIIFLHYSQQHKKNALMNVIDYFYYCNKKGDL